MNRSLPIWNHVKSDLAEEPVASTDHVERMTTWCQKLSAATRLDWEVLVAGALLHDVGVIIDRKNHYMAGRTRAMEILREVDFPEDKIEPALHVLEAHSRYGGAPEPQTLEAKIGQDADALEYVGAIGIVRAVVRGLNDGSFDGKARSFPEYLASILGKVEGTLHTNQADKFGRSRVEYMKSFLARFEKELNYEE